MFFSLLISDFTKKNRRFPSVPLHDHGLRSGKVTAMAQAKASAFAAPPTRGFPVRRFTQPLKKPQIMKKIRITGMIMIRKNSFLTFSATAMANEIRKRSFVTG